MPVYYATASQQNTSSSTATDLYFQNWYTGASNGAFIQKLFCGANTNAVDNQIRLQLLHLTAGTVTQGTAFIPGPLIAGGAAAVTTTTTLPTIASPTKGNPLVQLTYNTRGTALWAAFNNDEAITLLAGGAAGTNTSSPNTAIFLVSQTSGTSAISVPYQVQHSE